MHELVCQRVVFLQDLYLDLVWKAGTVIKIFETYRYYIQRQGIGSSLGNEI